MKSNYICVFCDERSRAESAYITTGRIGICADCFSRLKHNTFSQPFPGIGAISYILAPFEYSGTLRQTILDFKFKNCRAYAELFAGIMKEYLMSYGIWEDFDLIIPVPLHESRLRERGYNQSELIAGFISEIIGLPMRTDILRRNRPTKRQSSLVRSERVSNVKDAFECEKSLNGKRIIIIDDICTTGNTLCECAKPLHAAGAERICALTLAIHAKQNLPSFMY